MSNSPRSLKQLKRLEKLSLRSNMTGPSKSKRQPSSDKKVCRTTHCRSADSLSNGMSNSPRSRKPLTRLEKLSLQYSMMGPSKSRELPSSIKRVYQTTFCRSADSLSNEMSNLPRSPKPLKRLQKPRPGSGRQTFRTLQLDVTTQPPIS